jgi:hypothetical protein
VTVAPGLILTGEQKSLTGEHQYASWSRDHFRGSVDRLVWLLRIEMEHSQSRNGR